MAKNIKAKSAKISPNDRKIAKLNKAKAKLETKINGISDRTQVKISKLGASAQKKIGSISKRIGSIVKKIEALSAK